MSTVSRTAEGMVNQSSSSQESSSSKEVTEDGTEISQSSFKKEESQTKIEESSQSFSSTSVKSSAVKMTSSSVSSNAVANLPLTMAPAADDLMRQQDDFMQKALMESQDRFKQQQEQMMQQIQKQEVSQVMQKQVVGMTSSKTVVQESVEEEQGPPVGALDANGNQVEGEEAARPEAGGGDIPTSCPPAPTTSTTTSCTSESVREGEAVSARTEEVAAASMGEGTREEEKGEEGAPAEPYTVTESMTKDSETSATIEKTEVTSMPESSETVRSSGVIMEQNAAPTLSRSHTTEIEQESIKNTLREIISEIEEAVVSEVMTSESAEKSQSQEDDMSEKIYYQAIVSNSESKNAADAGSIVTESTNVDVTDQLRRQETYRSSYEDVELKAYSPPRVLYTPSTFIKNHPTSQVDLPPIQQLPPLEDLDSKVPARSSIPSSASKTLPRSFAPSSSAASSKKVIEGEVSEEMSSKTSGNLMHLWQSVQIAHELNQVLGSKANGPTPMQNGEVREEAKEQQQKTEETVQELRSEKVDEESSTTTTTGFSRETLTTSSSSSHTRHIDLEKLFTPASDSGELTPLSKNRKMYSSSSFYLPSHPTVEEQVDLARRISRSLADSSNQQSKGQSMYVNRKKRSVKWVHEGTDGGGGGGHAPNGVGPDTPSEEKLLSFKIPQVGPQEIHFKEKPASSGLRLVMNPRGQIQDLASLRRQGISVEPGPISPEVVFDLVKDLNSPKGRGAELFAKRRKRSENWVVDETTVKSSSSSVVMESQSSMSSSSMTTVKQPLSATAPLPPPSYLDHKRVEHIQKMNQIQERFTQPKLRLVKSPWEAALETGSVDTAFQELNRPMQTFGSTNAAEVAETVVRAARAVSPLPSYVPPPSFAPAPPAPTYVPTPAPTYIPTPAAQPHHPAPAAQNSAPFGAGRQDLYRPKAPRGWTTMEPSYSAPREAMQQMQEQPLPPPPPQAQTSAASTQKIHLTNLANYNTAPRGWHRDIDYYRPVTFASKV